MKSPKNLGKSTEQLWPFIWVIYFSALTVLVATLAIWWLRDIPPSFFTRDPTATLEGRSFTGAQSSLGVLVWCGAAAVCWFTWWLRRDWSRGESWFLILAGLLTTALMIDDLFCIHESRTLENLGIDETWVFALYGLLLLACLTIGRAVVKRSHYSLLILAMVFFAASLVVDLVWEESQSQWRIFIEDGFKLLGIVSWGGYLVWTCRQLIQDRQS